MRKIANLKCSVLALCISTVLVGCGNGDGDSSVTLLKGFYKDSEVVGLPYTCGSNSGLTDDDGAFLFPEGEMCTFFLDRARTVEVRTVEAASLSDGVVIYEGDPVIGQIFQSLDDDGNPDNGIVIDPSVVDAVIADPAFNGFPSTTEEANELTSIIDVNNGDLGVVGSSEAEAHMFRSLLTEADLYQNCSGRTAETALTKITFTEDDVVLLNDEGELAYSLDGGSLTVGSSTYTRSGMELFSLGAPLVLSNAAGGTSTLYATQEEAEAAIAESCAFGDAVAPAITMNGEATLELDLNSAFSDAGATVSDDADESVSVTVAGETEVDTSTVGSYEVVYSAIDASGNIATDVVRTVNVTNVTPPVLSLNGEASLTVAHASSYSDAGATAEDAVDGVLTPIKTGEVNTGTVGIYTIVYSAEDTAGNAAEAVTRTVTVSDQATPTISLLGNASITVAHGSTYADAGAAATDAVDGVLTPVPTSTVDTTTVGSYTVTYNVSDDAENNATPVTRNVIVTDQTAPTLSLTGDSIVTVAHGGTYTEAGATAIDAVDGVLVPVKTGVVDTSEVGTYTITYNVSDSVGNVATPLNRLVQVTDQTPPTLTLIGDAEITLAHGSPEYLDEGAIALDSLDGELEPVLKGSVNTNQVGTYSLTYNVSDEAGNVAVELTRLVHVTDQTPPVITLNGDAHIEIFLSLQYEDYQGATVSDNVDNNIVVETTHDIDEFSIGTYTVTYTATDSAGNEAVPVTREVSVIYIPTYPATFYEYNSFGGTHSFLQLTITNNFIFRDEGEYIDGSVDYSGVLGESFFRLEDGAFVPWNTELIASVEHTDFGRIIEDDLYEIRITGYEEITNQLISDYVSTDGLAPSAIMPRGSEVLTLGVKQIQDNYILFNEYFSSTYISSWSTLDKLLTNDCIGFGASLFGIDGLSFAFSCGQESQASGTLESSENINIGIWERVMLPQSEVEAIILTIDSQYLEDEGQNVQLMFVEKDGVVWQGAKINSSDEESEVTVFNEAAINAIIGSIIE